VHGRRIFGTLAAVLSCLTLASFAAARPQIVGGTPAPAGSWPSTAFLYGIYANQPFGCTGSVVAPEWIVTAAHCAYGAPGVFADSMTAVLNAKDYTDATAREVIGIDRMVVHPQYDADHDRNDIAMFHLSRPTTAPAIRLALKSEHDRYTSYIGMPNAAGWGRTDERSTQSTVVLQQAYLRLHSSSTECTAIAGFDLATQVCAGTEGKAGACHGDSGGPLVAFDKTAGDEPVLWGVTSYGPQAAMRLDPCSTAAAVVFTWVPAFTDFIQSLAATPPAVTPAPAPPPPVPAGPVPPAPTTQSRTCLSARAKVATAKNAEKAALKRLKALRKRKHVTAKRVKAASKLYHDRRAKRLRASYAAGKFCS
jgi:secreted trypsin-like serine protease